MENRIQNQIIRIEGELILEVYEKFIDSFNKIPLDRNITVYISSEGGDLWIGEEILDVLNTHKDNIELVVSAQVSSGAFEVAYKFKGKKRVLPGSMSVLHLYTDTFKYRELLKKNSYARWSKDVCLVRVIKEFNKMIETFLTKDEIKRINKGEDLYIHTDRLSEILMNTYE